MNTIKNIFRIWLPFAVVITAFCALAYASVQQAYRQGANDPQIQMAEDAADALAGGASIDVIVPVSKVSVAKGLAPFLIVYDGSGQVLASSVMLDGQTPGLPDGVLDSTKAMGENRVTWQPRTGVRIAAVIVSYQDGFVLAGRNLHRSLRPQDLPPCALRPARDACLYASRTTFATDDPPGLGRA